MFLFWKRKKDERIKEVVTGLTYFVDFEYWNQALRGKYSQKPKLEEWIAQIVKNENGIPCKEIRFFTKMDEITFLTQVPVEYRDYCKVVTVKKEDYYGKYCTSVQMLCALYEVLNEDKIASTVGVFTGDSFVLQPLEMLKKRGCQIVLSTISKTVSADFMKNFDSCMELPKKKEQKTQRIFENMILKSLYFLKENDKQATYGKTIANVAKHNRVSNKKIQFALDGMIADGYIKLRETEYEGKMVPILETDWEGLEKDKLWQTRIQTKENP